MSICDKINTAGETLEANLTARGISCDFGKNSDGKDTIQDMVEMITASNLRGIGDAIIHISASRPYLLSGEKTDLIVTLHNGVGTPLANKSVTVSDGTSSYTGITNNNGIFILYGIGVSATTTFTATYSSVSASCDVEYCLFTDYAVTAKSNYTAFYNYATFNPQVDSNGTLLTNNVASTYNYYANLDSTSDLYDFTAPFVLEFDIVEFTGTCGVQIVQTGESGLIKLFNALGITGACHLKITANGSQVIYQVDDNVPITETYTITKARLSLLINNGTVKYKNFRIREG